MKRGLGVAILCVVAAALGAVAGLVACENSAHRRYRRMERALP